MAITSIKTGSSFTNLVKYNDFLGPNPAYIPTSYESIASVTTASNQNTVTFSSIPATYQHLQVRIISRDRSASAAAYSQYIRVNGSTSSYASHNVYGNGNGIYSNGSINQNSISMQSVIPGDSANANVFGASIVDILDYASSTKNKTIRYVGGVNNNDSLDANQGISFGGGVWLSTTAITSITFGVISGAVGFKNGSVFALYGIKGA